MTAASTTLASEIRDPRAFAARYLTHHRLWGHPDEADILSDAMYGIALAVHDWDEDRDGPLLPWCWFKMRSVVAAGRRKRASYQAREARMVIVPDGEWLRCRSTDEAFRQVEDRLTLQRWADMAHLTDHQADSVAWMAVYGHQRGTGGLRDAGGNPSAFTAGLAKLRRVAQTGRPWLPHRGTRTDSYAPTRPEDVCANGHPWTPETRYVRPNGSAVCRVCRREGMRSTTRSPVPAVVGERAPDPGAGT